MTKVELTVAAAFESSDAVAGFEDIASAADEMASTVSDAGDSVTDAAADMGAVSDTAKDVSSNSRLASSSLGALAGGLEAVGATGAADALKQVQTVTSTLGGVGKAVTLVLKSQTAQMVAAKAAMVAQAVATRTVSAATKAYSIAQWLLNAALTANPIGVVIALVALLVGGIILAYKKSDTFREIVDRAMGVAKAGVEKLVEAVKGVPGFIEKVVDKVGFLAPAFEVAKTLIVGYIDLVTLPIRTLIGLVEDLVGWIGKIDFPDVPDGIKDLAGAVLRPVAGRGAGAGGVTVPVRVEGGFVGNEVQLARTIQDAVARELRRRGIR